MRIEKIGFQNTCKPIIPEQKFTSVNRHYVDCVSFGNSKHISIVGKRFFNKIHIVFSDVDGTISPCSDLVSKKTLEAVKILQKKEVPIILTTARCYKDTLPIIEQFGHRPCYTVLLQGGEIVDEMGKTIFECPISTSSGKNFVNWFKKSHQNDKDAHLIMYFNDEAYAESSIQYPWKSRCQIIQVNSFETLLNSGKKLQKALIYKPDEASGLHYKYSPLDLFEIAGINELDMKRSGRGFYEIQNKSVSKDKAIAFILKRININPKNSMAIGDSSNDVEMLDYIRNKKGLAIAMGNADDTVKKHANAITSTVDNDGFYIAIDNLF